MDSFGVLPSSSKLFAVRRPGVVAEPAEALEALAEFLGDGRRQPGVDVFEAALPGVAFRCGLHREEPLPTISRRSCFRIEEQVRFRGQPQQNRTQDLLLRGARRQASIGRGAFGITRKNELGYKQWIAEIRQRVVEALRGVDVAQSVQIVL